MRKAIHTAALTLAICPFLLAQSDTLVWYEGVQLQATDFLSTSREHALDISYRFDYQLLPGSLYSWRPVFRSRVVFDRKASSMAGEITVQNLKYAQIIFDLYGLHTRRVEERVFNLGEIQGAIFRAEDKIGRVLKASEGELRSELALFEKELSDAGAMSLLKPVLARWEKRISDSLRTYKGYELDEVAGKFRLGVFLGMGYASFLGRTADYFSNARSFNFLFQLDARERSRFALDMKLGGSRALRDFVHKDIWESGLRASFANAELTYGFKIPLSSRVLLIPFAGISVNEFTPRRAEDTDRRRVTGYSPVIGLEFDNVLFVFEDPREITKVGYKGKLSYSPSNFIGPIAGPQLNFSLTFGFDAGLVKTKMIMRQSAN